MLWYMNMQDLENNVKFCSPNQTFMFHLKNANIVVLVSNKLGNVYRDLTFDISGKQLLLSVDLFTFHLI